MCPDDAEEEETSFGVGSGFAKGEDGFLSHTQFASQLNGLLFKFVVIGSDFEDAGDDVNFIFEKGGKGFDC